MNAKFRDRLGSLIILGFTFVLYVQRDYMTPFGGIFPDIIMAFVAVFGVVALVLSFTPHAVMKEKKEEEEAGGYRIVEMVVVAAALLVWGGLLRQLGFVLSGVFWVSCISWYLSGRQRSIRVALISVAIGFAITYLLVYIFGHLLLVPLPRGTIFD